MLNTLLSSDRPLSKPLPERNVICGRPAVCRKLAISPLPSSASRSCLGERKIGMPANMPCAIAIVVKKDAGNSPVWSLHSGVSGTAQAQTYESSVRGLVVLMLIFPEDHTL